MALTRIVRVYTGADGRSHFEDLVIPMEQVHQSLRVSARSATLPVAGLVFRENPLGRAEEPHTPSRRQFVITLTGAVEIRGATESRIFGPGDVLFAEDMTGEGHANRELLGPRRSLILPVPDDFDIHRWARSP